jgi:hypothetical protein
VRAVSLLATALGAIALLIAIVGSVAGICSYVLSEADLVTPTTGAKLIATSFLCSLIAIPLGVVGWRWAERRRQYPVLAQSGAILAIGTLCAWFVVVTIALGK